MSNFNYLKTHEEYTLFSSACIEAEKIYASAPAMCAVGCRKALELAVKWVYSADKSLKPNIVFILCDDMGYGDLGCYGQKYIQTPHFNRMAQEGMRFTQAYAGSPVSAGFV